MDRDRRRVIALQIEGFLASVVRDHPALLDALDLAELRGITQDEVALLRREIAAGTQRRASVVTGAIERRTNTAGPAQRVGPVWQTDRQGETGSVRHR